MPTYDYRCPNGHRFERFFRNMSDSVAELPCRECDQTAVRQMSGGAGLIFKGSGFYITDYGKDGKKAQGAAPSTADASGGTGEGSGGGEKSAAGESTTKPAGSAGESKPEPKSESKPAPKPSKPDASSRGGGAAE